MFYFWTVHHRKIKGNTGLKQSYLKIWRHNYMNESIIQEQVRKSGPTYYKVNCIANNEVHCQTRNGPTGRFTTSLTQIFLPDFRKFAIIKNPNGKALDNNNSTKKETHLESLTTIDWSKDEIPDIEIIKLYKKENAKLRRDLIKKKSGEKLIVDTIEEQFKILPDLRIPPLPKPSNKSDEEIAVLHISDTQIGKITDTYCTVVAEERLLKLIKTTIRITQTRRNAAKINEIRIYLGGDMVEGEEIFPHQAHEISESVYDQATRTAPEILGKCILLLAEHFPKVKVIAVPGNHGRNGSRGTRSHPKTNWDSVCYKTLQYCLMGPSWNPRKELKDRIEFDYKDKWFFVDHIFDWGNLIVHGDQISGGFAGFPWYGTAKKAWGWIDSIPQPWDYLWFGHFHTYAGPVVLNKRIFLANGTTESDNEFAQASLAAAGYPCQRLCFFNAEHGLISDNQIYLDKRVPSKARALTWVS
jgi:hypothetical protein